MLTLWLFEEDFEVSIFLTNVSTRHSILFRQKHFEQDTESRLKSNSAKLMGLTNEAPIEIDEGGAESDIEPILVHEDSDEQDDGLMFVPEAPATQSLEPEAELRVSRTGHKRIRNTTESDSDSDFFETHQDPKDQDGALPTHGQEDDKKKLALTVSYDGFSIYERILCLVVKKRDAGKGKEKESRVESSAGQMMMEEWIASTQMVQEDEA